MPSLSLRRLLWFVLTPPVCVYACVLGDYRDELFRNNVHESVCSIMEANLNSPPVQEHGMRALMNLSCDRDQRAAQGKLLQARAPLRVVEGMRAHLTFAPIQESALRAIQNMAASRWANKRREALLRAGGVDGIMECLQIHDSSDALRRHGLDALTSLCMHNERCAEMIVAKLQTVPQLKAHAMIFRASSR